MSSAIAFDKEALICDFAETYHIYNYEALPLDLVGVLCFGLRENSRIKMGMNNKNVNTDTLLLAAIADRLSILCWKDTKDGMKGRNKPDMILDALLNEKKECEFRIFESIEDFERARKEILNG